MTKKEANHEKNALLNSVYSNNLSYAKTKSEKELLLRTIEAMVKVDRKDFVLNKSKSGAYIDMPLSIGYSQTISQPTTVARMLIFAELKKGLNALEIGSGSGWNAALLAYLVKPGKVISVERIKPLSDFAKKNFKDFKKKSELKLNASFTHGSALDRKSKIWKSYYDRIIVTAAASKELAKDLMGVAKLNDNGIIILPTEDGRIEVWRNKKGRLEKVYEDYGYAFVPLLK